MILSIDIGGTAVKMGLVDEGGEVHARHEASVCFDGYRTPILTTVMREAEAFLRRENAQVAGIGVSATGQVDDRAGVVIGTNGKIPGYEGARIKEEMESRFHLPVWVLNDANAAALGECFAGAARGRRHVLMLTLGTGVGGGVYVGGRTVHGLLHPEVGHMLLRPHPDDPNPRGVCPYHDGCLEGLAAGPAIGARIGGDARDLPDDHPTFRLEAHYLAQMCVNLILTVSPQRIVLGGGVMQRAALFPMVRAETLRLLGRYVQSPAVLEHIDEYIVAPALFPVSGLVGSYLIGKRALEERG